MRRRIEDVVTEFADYDLTIVWIYRDPVNVISSWMQMGWTTPEQINDLAIQWSVRNQMLLDYQGSGNKPAIVVRYEDLCNNLDLVSELGHMLGIQYVSMMESDSSAGRVRLDKSIQRRIDDLTSETLHRLDEIRTIKGKVESSASWTKKPVEADTLATTYPWRNERFDISHVHGQFNRMVNQLSGNQPTLLTAGETVPNIFTPEFKQNPHDMLKSWRNQAPVSRLPYAGSWLLHDAESVCAALENPDLYDRYTPTMQATSCPRHSVQDAPPPFNLPIIAKQRDDLVRDAIRHLLAAHVGSGQFDFRNDVTNSLVVTIYHEWLGVKMESIQDAYFLIQRENCPPLLKQWMTGSGVLADIVNHASEVSQNEVAWFNILFNSPGTVMDSVGCVLVELLRHPEWMEYARVNPDEIDAIVNEILRLYPPVIIIRRRVTAVSSLCGCDFAKGDTLYLATAAANRDERLFEDPDEFIPGRSSAARMFTFGSGMRKCPGASFAASDIANIMKAVILFHPQLEAAGDLDFITYVGGPYLHIPHEIPVRFGKHR